MGNCDFVITRKKQFAYWAISYKVEIDGVFFGEIKNGESLHCPLGEGIHEIAFKRAWKVYNNEVFYIPPEFTCVNMELKIDKRTGKLDVVHDEKVDDYIKQQRAYDKQRISKKNSSIEYVDSMEGLEFENWCADLLINNGFCNVRVTKSSGDQGVDVLAEKGEIKYAIQCKCYSSDLGNSPVQEVHAGKSLYNCHVGVVMTNRYFTSGAKELAEATGVLLWDREKLLHMIGSCEGCSSLSESAEKEDDLLLEAIKIVYESNQASIAMIQRKMKIGYSQAGKLIDDMENLGIIGKPNGTKLRKVLMSKAEIVKMFWGI